MFGKLCVEWSSGYLVGAKSYAGRLLLSVQLLGHELINCSIAHRLCGLVWEPERVPVTGFCVVQLRRVLQLR